MSKIHKSSYMPSEAEEWKRVTEGSDLTGDMFVSTVEFKATETVATNDEVELFVLPDKVRIIPPLCAVEPETGGLKMKIGTQNAIMEFSGELTTTKDTPNKFVGGNKPTFGELTDEPIVVKFKLTAGSIPKGSKVKFLIVGSTLC